MHVRAASRANIWGICFFFWGGGILPVSRVWGLTGRGELRDGLEGILRI